MCSFAITIADDAMRPIGCSVLLLAGKTPCLEGIMLKVLKSCHKTGTLISADHNVKTICDVLCDVGSC